MICKVFFFAPEDYDSSYACQHMSVFFLLLFFFFFNIPGLLNISPPLKFSLSLSLLISIRYILELFSRHTMIIRRSASMMMVVLHLIISLFMQIIFSIFHSSPFLIETKPISYPFRRPSILFQLLVSFSRFISFLI